jgi:hypothetical protein
VRSTFGPRQTGAVAKMDWRRATERDRAAGIERERPSAVEASFKAKWAGTCHTCGEPFEGGTAVASTLVEGKRAYSHERCIYGPTPTGPADAAVETGLQPDGRCQATTKRGDPCRGGAKKGELYCGPHLDQMLQAAETSEPDPFDEPF